MQAMKSFKQDKSYFGLITKKSANQCAYCLVRATVSISDYLEWNVIPPHSIFYVIQIDIHNI